MLTYTKKQKEEIRKRKEKARKRTYEACKFLQEKGAKDIYIFGSLASDTFNLHSDVDLAIDGLHPEYVYYVEKDLEDIMGDIGFDLVYLHSAPQNLRKKIKKSGKKWTQLF